MADHSLNITLKQKFIVAPQEVCQSCGNPSGRIFYLTELKGPSEAHCNNVFPTSVEYESLLSNIASAEAEMARLDKEMARILQSVALLQERKEAVQKYKIKEQSRFAPIRILPQEILRYIFFQLHLDGSASSSYETEDDGPSSYVRVITQVSAYWRAVAYSYPLLWTRVKVACPVERKAVTIMEPFIENYIELSQKLPLDVRIVTKEDRQSAYSLIKIVAKSIPRWQSLSCDSTDFFSKNKTFPRLTTLELRRIHSITLSSLPELKEIKIYCTWSSVSIHSAPLLTSLELFGSGPSAVSSNFPLSQITHL